MHNLVVGAVFKNEGHILDEWIRHYLARGVDHIFLVNDFSTDDFEAKLLPFADKVTLFHNDIVTQSLGRQTQIYEKYFRPILPLTKWIAILDLDEFLYSRETLDLSSIIERYNEYSAIIVDWLHFGSSGHIQQPSSVVNGFRMRANFDTTKDYYANKSILKADKILRFLIHKHNVIGEQVHIHYSEDAPLIINHYTLQSLEFFTKVKMTRGDIDNYIQTTSRKRDIEFFNSYDVNTIKDDYLYNQTMDIPN
jgi:hypothetical protein